MDTPTRPGSGTITGFPSGWMASKSMTTGRGTADIVVAAGVFYHLMNPLKFIEDLTCLMGPVSRLYMTTFCLKDIRHPDPIMRFAYGWNGDNTNYWLASVSCVMQMLQYAGLNLIERYQVLPGTDQHPEPLIMFHARKA